jgi:hypothetical protein
MSFRWDLAVHDRDNRLVLVVVVKKKLDAPLTWANQLRRNILSHGDLPATTYFLIACPDRLHLWNHATASNDRVQEPWIIDARPIFQPYFERSGFGADRIGVDSLELMVSSWLEDVIHRAPDTLDSSQAWLTESGLFAAISGGVLETEALA